MANKGNKVFYGEYTLGHWLDLIIKGNIVLPPYQRYFVWDDEKTKKLIESIKAEEFVPPVTIGAYKDGEKKLNLIIDGQQRLTSILLAAIGYFPDRDKYEKVITSFADENDDNVNTNDGIPTDANDIDNTENMIDWNLNKLLNKKITNLKDLKDSISNGERGFYKRLDNEFDKLLSEDDLKKYYLGFSYLVPNANEGDNSQKKYYSTVFRNINMQGEALSDLESREALYYLQSDFKNFFHPDFSDNYKVKGKRMDFVRYLALLSQFKKSNHSAYKLARGYSKKMERYYEDYIYSIVGEKTESVFLKLEDTVGGKDYTERLENVRVSMETMGIDRNCSSIIDLDVYLFGLIYYTMFENKKLDFNKKNSLIDRISGKIAQFKSDYNHKKTPSALVHIKNRVIDSIAIYGDFLDE